MCHALRHAVLASGCLLALLAARGAAADDIERVGPPGSIGAAGDSTTTAALAGELAPEVWRNSWATGDSTPVQSHYLRLLALNPAARGRTFNAAVSGQRMRHLEAQAQRVVAAQPEYVVLLMGANDACASREEEMPPVETFRAQFEAALSTLSRGLPDSRLYVLSIPDVYRLWEVYHGDFTARFLWDSFGHCQSMLARPASTAAADVARRERVRQRIRDYNQQLAEVCSQYLHCRDDKGAVFSYSFTREDVSSFDFFHPSEVGQRQLAAVSWAAGYDFSDTVAPTSSARSLAHPDGVQVELSAIDDVQVAGLEFRDAAGSWQRYTGPLLRQVGEALTFRAVDVNGNVEAARTYLVEVPPAEPPRGPIVAEGDAGVEAGEPGVPGVEELGEAGPVGCGCTASAGGAGAWSLLVLVAPWLLRRGRRRGMDASCHERLPLPPAARRPPALP